MCLPRVYLAKSPTPPAPATVASWKTLNALSAETWFDTNKSPKFARRRFRLGTSSKLYARLDNMLTLHI